MAKKKNAKKGKTAARATKKTVARKSAKKTSAKKATKGHSKAARVTAHVAKKERRVIGPINTNFDRIDRVRTKGGIYGAIATSTGLTRNEIRNVFDSLNNLIGHDLKKGPGTFVIPGLLKMVVKKKPATKARKGINPFTGEEMTFKAKPAQNVVRARPLKALKEMAD